MGSEFYIQKGRDFEGNDLLWRTAASGTTCDLRQAQCFGHSESERISSLPPTDRVWPKAYIDTKSRPAVVRQALAITEALAGMNIVLTVYPPRRAKPEVVNCPGCGRFLNEAQRWAGACAHCGTDNRP
jgi:hypothetical protein